MAISANNSNEEVAGGSGIPLYVGIAPMKVVAVNPTLAELQANGVNMQNEPQYTDVSIGGDQYNKLTFWLRCLEPNFTTRFDVLVKPSIVLLSPVSCSGATLSVGAFADQKASKHTSGSRTLVSDRLTSVRELLDFIKAYANVANGDECAFETIDRIMAGDVTRSSSSSMHCPTTVLEFCSVSRMVATSRCTPSTSVDSSRSARTCLSSS